MQLRLFIASIGLLGAAALGCTKMEPMDTADLAMPAQLDMRKPGSCVDNEGTKAVGEACTNSTKCDCSGPSPTCLSDIDVGDGMSVALPGGYCSNSKCSIGKNDTCGDNGRCADITGSGAPICLQGCTKGRCREGYACLRILTDPMDPNSKNAAVCAPTEGLIDCDPTADPTTQCTSVGGQKVADSTNGNPNGACVRFGALQGLLSPDPAGQCAFFPCQIGPKNCPGSASCFYLDVTKNLRGSDPADKFKGNVCISAGASQKKDGDTCMGGFNTCGDNFFCVIPQGQTMGSCRQLCFNGTQKTYTGGNAMYKNAALKCPGTQTCDNIYGLAGTDWPGVCKP